MRLVQGLTKILFLITDFQKEKNIGIVSDKIFLHAKYIVLALDNLLKLWQRFFR